MRTEKYPAYDLALDESQRNFVLHVSIRLWKSESLIIGLLWSQLRCLLGIAFTHWYFMISH